MPPDDERPGHRGGNLNRDEETILNVDIEAFVRSMKPEPDDFPQALYVGKAVMLRNRLQQHMIWDRLYSGVEIAYDLARVLLAAWYIDDEIERKRAEAALIRLLMPKFNRVDEGGIEWTLRPPDVEDVDPLTVRPESRRDIGETGCDIPNRPGVYLWYYEASACSPDDMASLAGWRPRR